MAKAIFVAVAVLALAGTASAAVFSTEPALSEPWVRVGDAAATTPIRLSFSLKSTNQDRLTEIAMAVSDPQNPRYTNYLTGEEVDAITAPEKDALPAVLAFLNQHDVDYEVSPHMNTVTVRTTTAKASQLLSTSFSAVRNGVTGQQAVRGGDVVLPESVAQHLEAVFGVHGLPLPPRAHLVRDQSPDDDSGGTPYSVTPSVIETAYNVTGQVKPTGSTTNRQAVAEFQGQLLSTADLKTFFSQYVPKAKSGDDTVFKFVGDSQQGEGVEANLDIQYIMGVAVGVKTEAWQYAGQDFCSDLKQWTDQIKTTTNPPTVFSVSYGWQGDMSQIGCTTAEITAIDNNYKAVTAMGISIIFASGDSGSALTNNMLYASWPASSQWVTAVGATRFIGQMPGQGERSVDQFGSGGGFSRIVTPAPAFQTSAIAGFYKKETNAPPQSMYGYGGRGTPDVAALGEGFQVIQQGSPITVGGTSASAPTFSALVSLLNQAREQAGKKAMGNLNQWIYQNGHIFNDVTVGSDRVGRSGQQFQYGFDCVEGWDPVTGFGSVQFDKFLEAGKKA